MNVLKETKAALADAKDIALPVGALLADQTNIQRDDRSGITDKVKIGLT